MTVQMNVFLCTTCRARQAAQ